MSLLTLTRFFLILLLVPTTILADDTGRYQLFHGEYKATLVDGSEKYIKGLFKVDTKTGEIFLCDETELREEKDGQDVLVTRRRCQSFEGVSEQPGFTKPSPEANGEEADATSGPE